MKTYIIRQIYFEYDDSHYFANGFEERNTLVFDDEQKAHQKYVELERQAFQEEGYMDRFERNRPTEGEHPHEKLAHFYQQTFKQEFDFSQPKIPAQATFEQVDYILTLYGLRFYTLTVFEGKAVYYKIATTEKHWQDYDTLARPYDTFQEAEQAALGLMMEDLEMGYYSSLEELSDAPTMLLAYLKNCTLLEYVEAENPVLRFKEFLAALSWEQGRAMQVVEARGLLPFLRKPPFRIKEKSYQS
jgi:hypothetical protein